MSRRTFTRAFKHELGMGFALWRQQVRLMQAVSLLAAGRSITSVASDVGYESPECLHRDVPPRLRRTAERVHGTLSGASLSQVHAAPQPRCSVAR